MLSTRTPRRIIIILGMHRSGTSFLTGSLQKAGLELGEFSSWNPHNQKGNRENTEIVEINDCVLESNHGDWLTPPQQCPWSEQQLERGKVLLDTYSDIDVFGFKDPRTLITLNGWLSIAPHSEFVGIFRHPSAVVKSLVKRGQVTESQGISAWISYNQALLARYKIKPFPIFCFDWPEHKLHQRLNKFITSKNLSPLNHEDKFFSKKLLHQSKTDDIQLPLKAKIIYWRLLLLAKLNYSL